MGMNTLIRALLMFFHPLYRPTLAPVRIDRSQRRYFAHPGMKSR